MNAGGKGIRILAPIVGVRRKKDEEADKDITKQNTRTLLGFRNAYVFDVSADRTAIDLPGDAPSLRRPRREHRPLVATFLEAGAGHPACLQPRRSLPRLGMSYGGRIAILPGQSKAEEFSTLVHETGARDVAQGRAPHEPRPKPYGRQRPRQSPLWWARPLDLVTGSASADYIQLYHGNASLLARELGSHPADRQRHPCRAGAARCRRRSGRGD